MSLSVTLEPTMNMTSGPGASPGCPTLLPERSQRLKADQKRLCPAPKRCSHQAKALKYTFFSFNGRGLTSFGEGCFK